MPEIQLLQNPGFETGSLAPWVSTGTVTIETSSASDRAHTGTKFILLETSSSASASISQTVLLPILPLKSLRLLFWMKRKTGIGNATDITATVTPLGSPFPVITISIPEDTNPNNTTDQWLSYEEVSGPILFPAIGVTVTITVASGQNNKVDFDDIFLIEDI